MIDAPTPKPSSPSKQEPIDTPNPPSREPPNPLLIFILGPPCSGKTTLSTALQEEAHHPLTHISIGNELRSLTSPTPPPHLLPLLSTFPPKDFQTIKSNVEAGTLIPTPLILQFLTPLLFPPATTNTNTNTGTITTTTAATTTTQTRACTLIDGFPRATDQWLAFKQHVRHLWTPGPDTVVLVLDMSEREARSRFLGRARPNDVFWPRFRAFGESIGGIVGDMRRDGVVVIEVGEEETREGERMVGFVKRELGCIEGWGRMFGTVG